MRMQILDIITKKKLGQPLTREEITFFARGAADKTIPDYQLAALLMAIRINGMTDRETVRLTIDMEHSGDATCLRFRARRLTSTPPAAWAIRRR